MKKIFTSKILIIIYSFFLIIGLVKLFTNFLAKKHPQLIIRESNAEINKTPNLEPKSAKLNQASNQKSNPVIINNPKSNHLTDIKPQHHKKTNSDSKKQKTEQKISTSTIELQESVLIQPDKTKFTSSPRIELSTASNSKITGTKAKFLIPIYQNSNSDQLAYIDLRAGINNTTTHHTDIGLGFRKLFSNTSFLNQPQWIFGIYSNLGRTYTRYKNELQQVSFGIEALSSDYDFRANYYVAGRQEKVIDATVTHSIESGQHNYTRYSLYQKALGGADFELGYKLPIKTVDVKIFAGGYFYQKPKKTQISIGQSDTILNHRGYNRINGQKLRLELGLGKLIDNPDVNLTIATQYKHDNLNQGQSSVMAKLSYQFGNNYNPLILKSGNDNYRDLRYRMNEFAIRNDIVIDQRAEIVNSKVEYEEEQPDDSGGDQPDNEDPEDLNGVVDGRSEVGPGDF